jgi:hypothetical protein
MKEFLKESFKSLMSVLSFWAAIFLGFGLACGISALISMVIL